VEALRSIGVFRVLVPRSHGGLELDLQTALEIIGALGRIDGSVGWTATIVSGSASFAPLLPRETYEQVYQNGPDVRVVWKKTGRYRLLGPVSASKLSDDSIMLSFAIETDCEALLPRTRFCAL
jgi:hypothetical protein